LEEQTSSTHEDEQQVQGMLRGDGDGLGDVAEDTLSESHAGSRAMAMNGVGRARRGLQTEQSASFVMLRDRELERELQRQKAREAEMMEKLEMQAKTMEELNVRLVNSEKQVA
jgi:hypothetical protein